MKQILLYTAFICLAVLSTSCKKDKIHKDNEDAYITFKLDGVQKSYKAKAVAVLVPVNDVYGLGLSAYESSSSLEMFYLYIAEKK